MIETKDLRVGNWIKWPSLGDHQEILTLDNIHCHMYMEPILLTEELLLKFGFEPSGSSAIMCWQLNIDRAGLLQWFDDSSFSLVPTGSNTAFCPDGIIEYVHQLQNLYFALTGNELTIR